MRVIAAILAFALTIGPALPKIARADDDPWFGRDKALHFGVSITLTVGVYGLSSIWIEDRFARIAIGAGTAASLGVAKEIYDSTGRGDASWRDLTWDAIGVGTGVLLVWLIDVLSSEWSR